MYSRRSTGTAVSGASVGRTVQRRSVLLLDATVPLIVGAVIVVAGVLHGGSSVRPLTLIVGLAAALTLVGRRRAPGWTLLISAALVQILFVIDAAVGPVAVLAPAVALYSLALTKGRVLQLLGAVAAVAVVIAADVLHKGHATVLQTLGHVALAAVPLLAAEIMRTRRAYVAVLRERIALAEQSREQEAQRRVEQERLRIARDLHDVVAHTLTTINVQAAVAGHLLDRDPGHARGAIALIESASRDAIAELRAILGVLRDRNHPDAPHAPAPTVDDITELVAHARQNGLGIELEIIGTRPQHLSDAASLAAYRIVQESLTNAQRHAPGAFVRVTLSYQSVALALAIENDAGAAPSAPPNGTSPGVGVIGMTERAEAVGGTLHAAPLPSGFRVDTELPYALGAA